MRTFTGEACAVAAIVPSAEIPARTVGAALIVILVVCREMHSVYASMTAFPHGVRGVSAVAVKVKTILIVCLVADGE